MYIVKYRVYSVYSVYVCWTCLWYWCPKWDASVASASLPLSPWKKRSQGGRIFGEKKWFPGVCVEARVEWWGGFPSYRNDFITLMKGLFWAVSNFHQLLKYFLSAVHSYSHSVCYKGKCHCYSAMDSVTLKAYKVKDCGQYLGSDNCIWNAKKNFASSA